MQRTCASGVLVCITAGSDLLSHTVSHAEHLLPLALRARAAVPADGRHGKPWGPGGRCRSKRKSRDDSHLGSRDNCRQRPTLPHSFPCSTIGGSRLNFRVRNGNGCDPAPMTTGILVAGSHRTRPTYRLGRPARTTYEWCASLSRQSPKGDGGSQTILSKNNWQVGELVNW